MMHAKNGETVELVALSSLSMAELDTNISELSQDISNMSATLKKMKNIHSEISEDAKKEEVCSEDVSSVPYCKLYKWKLSHPSNSTICRMRAIPMSCNTLRKSMLVTMLWEEVDLS